MLSFEDLATHLRGAASALVRAAGDPSTALVTIPAPSGDGAVTLVREGYTVGTLAGPKKGRRTHEIEDLGSFAEWLDRHATDQHRCEVLVGDTTVVASLDPADPYADLVTCPLTVHPRLARWVRAMGAGKLAQRDLHRLVMSSPEDFDLVQDQNGAHMGTYGPMLAAQLQKFGAVKTSEVSIEIDERGVCTFAAQTEKVAISGKLPATFGVVVPFFLGVEVDRAEATYRLEVFLGVEANEKGAPDFVLRCPQFDVVRRQARLDAAEYLRRELGGDFLVGLGKLSTVVVPDVRR